MAWEKKNNEGERLSTFDPNHRIIIQHQGEKSWVSTVCLGSNYAGREGLTFETMVFDGPHSFWDVWAERTFDEVDALKAHIEALLWANKHKESK